MTGSIRYDVVVPTVGRPSLSRLLQAILSGSGPGPGRLIVVDDRADPDRHLLAEDHILAVADRVEVIASGGRGPAGARNAGWRRSRADWIAFLDDDVLVPDDWADRLVADLAGLPRQVAASQGRILVPLPADRAPTDWERNVAGLEDALWATADMAYRREALAAVGGFDERFPRAYREDADLGLRVTAAGWEIVRGDRTTIHPVRSTDDAVSLRMQAGNAEDPFMRALHGHPWRERAGVPSGRRPWHLATVVAAAAALGAGASGRRRVTVGAGATWLALTADLAWMRIAAGPPDPLEILRMLWTSAVLPFAATWHWLRGIVETPRRLRRAGPAPSLPGAVLFDRDGTLVHDVPYNGDPDKVTPVAGAREVLDCLRALGVPVGLVTNQSGIGRGIISPEQLAAVDGRIAELLGPFDAWAVCPHAPGDNCHCRKPAPGLIQRAAQDIGVQPSDVVVVGDVGSDVAAAEAAGARGILVPNGATRPEEVVAARYVAADLGEALQLALGVGDGE